MTVKKTEAPFYERLALVLVGILVLGYLVILGKDFLDPLVFGFLFAILLLPIADFFEKKVRLPRGAAGPLAIVSLIGVIYGVMYLVGSQVANLANDWPMLSKQVSSSIRELQGWIESAFHI